MNQVFKDIVFALRMMRANPGFTAVGILTLALSIGAATAIYSFSDAVLLRPLPYPHADDIVQLWEKPPRAVRSPISAPTFLSWKENQVFTMMAAEANAAMTMTGSGEPLQIRASRVSSSFFEIFGAKAMLGRTFAPDEDQPGHEHVAVLSNRIWRNKFSSDPNIIGRNLNLNNASYTVIGVMPPDSRFDHGWQDLWCPLTFQQDRMVRNFRYLFGWARLKPGVSIEQATTQMQSIASGVESSFPDTNKGWGITIDLYAERIVGPDLRSSLYVLIIAVGVVILIACVNLASLLFAKGAYREHELAVRAALGAARGRIIRQLFTENLLLAIFGGVLGVLVGYGLMIFLKASLPPFFLPIDTSVHLNVRVLLAVLVVILGMSVVFGMAPAFYSSLVNVRDSLQQGAWGNTAGGMRTRVQRFLVIVEVGLAFVLVCSAGFIIRSFAHINALDLGVQTENILTMRLPMNEQQYTDRAKIISYLDQVSQKVSAVPGVSSVGVTSAIPLRGVGYQASFMIQGEPFIDPPDRPFCYFKVVSPSYFTTLGMRVIRGRTPTEADAFGGQPVAVVNESLVKTYFNNQDPIGKYVLVEPIIPGQRVSGSEIPWLVVGVVADEKVRNVYWGYEGMYVSYRQSPGTLNALVVRGNIAPENFAHDVEKAVWSVNKDQALDDINTLKKIKSDSIGEERLRSLVLGIFGGVALLLAAIGIYGVLSYLVAQRAHEIGIRAALGARKIDQFTLVLWNGIILTILGLVLGLIGSFGATRVISNFIYGMSPHDPVTLLVVALMLIAVCLLGCFIPAWRATRVEPLTAMKNL